jgi:hypothetical protein
MKVLNAGTVVHVCGWPVELRANTEVGTDDGNWQLIQDDLARASKEARTLAAVDPVGRVGNETQRA